MLTGRKRAYGYWQTERFLSPIAHAGGDQTLTDALASWTSKRWSSSTSLPGSLPPTFSVDGHRTPVFRGHVLPRGLIGRTGNVLGGRTLLFLHDVLGHPHLATTHRGDLHLTKGVPELLARSDQATHGPVVARLIVDREGMAGEFLHLLAAQGRIVVTILTSNQ